MIFLVVLAALGLLLTSLEAVRQRALRKRVELLATTWERNSDHWKMLAGSWRHLYFRTLGEAEPSPADIGE